MTIAPPPPLPSPDAEADVWARYTLELENYRAATARLHAQAQADTAAAMNRNADAKWAQSRQELVMFFAEQMPQRATDTPNTYLDACAAMADQYLKEHGAP